MTSRHFRLSQSVRSVAGAIAFLVSVGTFDASAADLTMSANTTWALSGGQDSSSVDNAVSGDNVAISSNANLNVTNQGGADDGNGAGTYVLGNVTGTGTMDSGNAGGGLVTTTFNSINLSGNVTLRNSNPGDASINHTVTNGVTTAATLSVSNAEATVNGTTTTVLIGGNVSANALNVTANVGGGGGANTNLTLNGSTIAVATNITLDDNTGISTVTFGGTSPQTISGAILGAGAGEGRIFVTSDARFMNNIGATQLLLFSVSATQKATFNGSVLGATTINNSGSMVFNNSVTATGTTFDLNASGGDNLSSIILGTNSYTNNTVITATGVTNVNATNVVNVVLPSTFASGALTLIDGPGTGAGTADNTNRYTLVTSNSNVLSTYALSIANTDDVVLTATRKASQTVAGEIETPQPVADILLKSVETLAGDTEAYNAALGAMQSSAGARDAAIKMLADMSQAPLRAATDVIGTLGSTLSAQMTSTGAGAPAAGTGVSTGDAAGDNLLWARPFGTFGEQDDINLTPGYDFWSTGVLLGVDRPITDNARVGLSFGYSYTDISGNGATQRDSETNGYYFGLYGDFNWDALFLQWMTGYTLNDIEARRTIALGGLTRVAVGDYDVHQYSLQSKLGYVFSVAERQELVPTIGILLDWQTPEGYSETGAGAFNLNVDHDDRFAALGLAGLEYRYHADVNENVTGTYKLRSNVSYDFEGENGRVTTGFVTGGNAVDIEGEDVEEFGASFGGGIDFGFNQDRVVLGLGYDFELRSDFQAHIVQAEARFHF